MSSWTRAETRETLYSMQAPYSLKAEEAGENLGGGSGLYQETKGRSTWSIHRGDLLGQGGSQRIIRPKGPKILVECYVIELTGFEAQEPPTDLGFLAANSSVVGTKVSRLANWSTTMPGKESFESKIMHTLP